MSANMSAYPSSCTSSPTGKSHPVSPSAFSATYRGGDEPAISYGPVKITSSQPGKRAYGAAGLEAEAERKGKEAAHA